MKKYTEYLSITSKEGMRVIVKSFHSMYSKSFTRIIYDFGSIFFSPLRLTAIYS